jgi:hypothetical protein
MYPPRRTGLSLALLFLSIACAPLRRHAPLREWALALSAILALLAWQAPRALRPIHAVTSRIVYAVQLILSEIILAVMFFALITPARLLLQAFGKRPLALSFHRSSATYWVAPPAAPSSFRNLF